MFVCVCVCFWGLNPEPHECQATVLPLSYIPNPIVGLFPRIFLLGKFLPSYICAVCTKGVTSWSMMPQSSLVKASRCWEILGEPWWYWFLSLIVNPWIFLTEKSGWEITAVLVFFHAVLPHITWKWSASHLVRYDLWTRLCRRRVSTPIWEPYTLQITFHTIQTFSEYKILSWGLNKWILFWRYFKFCETTENISN